MMTVCHRVCMLLVSTLYVYFFRLLSSQKGEQVVTPLRGAGNDLLFSHTLFHSLPPAELHPTALKSNGASTELRVMGTPLPGTGGKYRILLYLWTTL